jgi:hypothetical protein
VLNIVDAIWVPYTSLSGYPENTTVRVNQILASQNPVALDYWAAKYILYPIDQNFRHHPDYPGISTWLTGAAATINNRGGLYHPENGIFVGKVTTNETLMVTHRASVVVTLLDPNGDAPISSGSQHRVEWAARFEAITFRLDLSMDRGATWGLIAKDIPVTFCDWTVPVPANNRRECLVRVTAYDTGGKQIGKDRSDKPFAIEVVKVMTPAPDSIWVSGDTYDIVWQTSATKRPVAKAELYYTKNGGAAWVVIDTVVENPGTYPWKVPPVNILKERCKVKVVLLDGQRKTVGSTSSEGFFSIQPG